MYIVTGGAGFIGSWVVRELQSRGMGPIVIVDNLDGEKWRNLIGVKAQIFSIQKEDPDYIGFEDVEAVIHMGGISSTSETDADKLYEMNVRHTLDWMELARRCKAPFIYASSAAVYGNGPFSDDQPTEWLRPLNAYGWSKQQADLLVDYGVGLRFFNVYGLGEAHKGKQRSYITKCLDIEGTSESPRLFTDTGECARDWVWVGDCAKICVDLLDKNIKGVLNVGTGQKRAFNTVLDIFVRGDVDAGPPPEGYQRYTQAALVKFRTIFPDFKFLTLEEGIEKYRSMLLTK